jgi:hypothetical protein
MFETILKRNNLTYSDLTPEERSDLKQMRQSIQMEHVDMDKIEEHIRDLIEDVTNELTGVGDASWSIFFRGRRDEHLKARLRNYRLLLEIFTRPERMRDHAERQLRANLEIDKSGGGGGII